MQYKSQANLQYYFPLFFSSPCPPHKLSPHVPHAQYKQTNKHHPNDTDFPDTTYRSYPTALKTLKFPKCLVFSPLIPPFAMSPLHLLLLLLLNIAVAVVSHGGGDDDGDEQSPSEHPDLRSKSLVLAKIWCLMVIFAATFVGGVSPYFVKWNEGFLVLGTQFAGGVFLGTAMMHFLSDANETFGDLTTKEYPFAFMLACAGYLLTMLADSAISSVYAGDDDARSRSPGDLELPGLCLKLAK